MSDQERPIEELGFEEAMESLDTLVSSLESGQLPLEEMVGAYERGMALLRVCRSRIDTARRRVEAINLNLEGKTQATLTEFAPMDTPETASPASPASPKRSSKSKEPGDKAGSGEIRLF
ncbi:exodeoxyribonuclease VII small subunit [Phragmitibacter flavus]|uniref:Exodeoxyribonuclease 7 small subunit n=1 Tax=Phragmitibacter flavus TaxID=2576071 RepID=A0A5R8KDZ6_9BACT|nr:exodeoxyribonuclease VII small subunit [Phragmitibacter flavus]TLD70477.1 exodeoxyribonuclease VII small subunit [Phragmitibacter flavus]